MSDVATLAFLALLLACNARPLPDDDDVPPEVRAYARARCQTLETCGCESDAYQGRDECEDAVIAIYTEHLADDETLDLSWSASRAAASHPTSKENPVRRPRPALTGPARTSTARAGSASARRTTASRARPTASACRPCA